MKSASFQTKKLRIYFYVFDAIQVLIAVKKSAASHIILPKIQFSLSLIKESNFFFFLFFNFLFSFLFSLLCQFYLKFFSFF